MANGKFGGGDGSIINPLIIEDVADLLAVNDGLLSYRLGGDIDLSGVVFFGFDFGTAGYGGVFDGAGYSVKNWSSTVQSDDLAFFKRLGTNSVVINTHLKNVNLINTGAGATAGLVAILSASSSISGCSTSGSIVGAGIAGGLVASSGLTSAPHSSYVDNSFSTCVVTGDASVGGFMGGSNHAGTIYITNCYSTGNVYGRLYVGGFLGREYARVHMVNCYSSGAVHGERYVGGFVGIPHAKPWDKNCYALAPYVKRIAGVSSYFGAYRGGTTDTSGVSGCYSLTTTEFRSG